jgi:muconolactone delta-isomerase
MKKFLVLYRAPLSSFELMKKATPEQQKSGMEAWMAWSQKAASSIVDMGAPLGKSLRLTTSGTSPVANDLGGYSIFQAESQEALAETLAGHPHFMMPEGTIDVIELIPMPGTSAP